MIPVPLVGDDLQAIEDVIRQLACRTCGAVAFQECTYPAWAGPLSGKYSHTLRYQDAADGGLVPYLRNGYRV